MKICEYMRFNPYMTLFKTRLEIDIKELDILTFIVPQISFTLLSFYLRYMITNIKLLGNDK